MNNLGKGPINTGPPPPLPPRESSSSGTASFGKLYNDPRSNSTQSITPSLPGYEEVERRKLLIVYIHGFMGNDTSFQSFPAHVHKYLKLALADTHVIHSKIYPKYKTYKSIDVARDKFSAWLEPHESPMTDVVLVGHSMGGLLAADVVLMRSPNQSQHFKHRILGTLHLDVPLLGMHPGIVVAGLSSIFRKNEPPKPVEDLDVRPALGPSTSSLGSPPPYSIHSDPSTSSLPSPPAPFAAPALRRDETFNPNWVNDVRMEERSWWRNILHFVDKHNSEGLIGAAKNHIMSHMEFGGALMDLGTLKSRYETIRKLEDVDDFHHDASAPDLPRVRFVQYYTVCHGYPKAPKAADGTVPDTVATPTDRELGLSESTTQVSMEPPSYADKNEEIYEGKGEDKNETWEEMPEEDDAASDIERSSLEMLSPEPMVDEPLLDSEKSTSEPKTVDDVKSSTGDTEEKTTEGQEPKPEDLADDLAALDFGLPAIPDPPTQPELADLDQYTDKDARKLAEKEGKRLQKVYDQAVKDRQKMIKEREKIIEKRKKKQAQEAEKAKKDAEKKAKEAEKQQKKEEEAEKKRKQAAETSGASSTTMPAPNTEERIASPTPSAAGTSLNLAATQSQSRNDSLPSSSSSPTAAKKQKPVKDRRFCNLAKTSDGAVDPRWIRVFMKDMDEVAAHTGLFFAGEHYERLVGDVSGTIVDWVHADLSRRAIMALD